MTTTTRKSSPRQIDEEAHMTTHSSFSCSPTDIFPRRRFRAYLSCLNHPINSYSYTLAGPNNGEMTRLPKRKPVIESRLPSVQLSTRHSRSQMSVRWSAKKEPRLDNRFRFRHPMKSLRPPSSPSSSFRNSWPTTAYLNSAVTTFFRIAASPSPYCRLQSVCSFDSSWKMKLSSTIYHFPFFPVAPSLSFLGYRSLHFDFQEERKDREKQIVFLVFLRICHLSRPLSVIHSVKSSQVIFTLEIKWKNKKNDDSQMSIVANPFQQRSREKKKNNKPWNSAMQV